MKTLIALFFVSAYFLSGCSVSSLSTVANNGWILTLYHYTNDVKIQENGQDMTLVKAYAAHKKAGYIAYTHDSNGSDLYTNGIHLDKSVTNHTITIIKNGKTVTVPIEKKSKPFIDITAALGETSAMSLAALQKEFLKNHKK